MARTYLVIIGELIEKETVELNVRDISGVTFDARPVFVPGLHKEDSNRGSSTKDKCAIDGA
jgi:hypothetical protein